MKLRLFMAFTWLLCTPALAQACAAIATNVAGASACLKPGDAFKDCPDCPEMVVVPAGRDFIGSSVVIQATINEAPSHEVTFASPFAVGKFEITRGQYAAFEKESGFDDTQYWRDCVTIDIEGFGKARGKTWKDPGFAQDDSHPAVCVSWNAASAYVKWLSQKTGERYRLLSESEWEYAARGGSNDEGSLTNVSSTVCARMNLGDLSASRVPALAANYARYNSPYHPCDDGFGYTAPVGSFPANGFGLHDMLGNVAEWVQDCYVASYVGAPIDGSAVTGKTGCDHVHRGGAWFWPESMVRPAARAKGPNNTNDDKGFRIARDLVSSSWWPW